SLPALLFKTTVIKRRPPIRRPIPAAKSPSRPSDILKKEVSIQSARSVLSRAKVEPSEERVVAAKFEPVKGFSIKDLLTDGIQIPSRDEIIDRLPKDSTLY